MQYGSLLRAQILTFHNFQALPLASTHFTEILLLDEPTSGLDSFTARHLVSTLVELAHKGDKLVVMTVHQPRQDIVNMLDKLAILTSGQLAYLGPPSEMVTHFTSIGYPCPKNQNPCDVYIDVTSVDRRNPEREKETLARAKSICQAFQQSNLHEDIVHNFAGDTKYRLDDNTDLALTKLNQVDVTSVDRRKPEREKETLSRAKSICQAFQQSKLHEDIVHNFAGDTKCRLDDNTDLATPKLNQGPSWFRVFQCLLERMNVHLWRDRSRFVGRLTQQAFFVPFLILYIGRVGDGVGGIQDRLGLIYQAVSSAPYLALTNAVAIIPTLRETYYRESHDGMYSIATFLAAYYVHTLPFNIISGALFSTFLYWVVGFKDDLVVFGMFVLVIIMMGQFGEMMAVGFMGVIRPVQLACDTTSLLFNTSAFFGSGLIRSLATMPKVLENIGFVAIHRYSTETVMANEFHGLKLACSHDQCLSGDDFLASHYPGARDHISRNFWVMGGYILAVLAIAICMFKARGVPTLH
ncbi:ATP-binding cassette sub-family G member 5 [Elysia marginata]|uniref:ATP-binding cassette sub-family G member 5 n=1 Tax=Elysia marginata TaxID=1093978 RepID=A0AAV4HKB5_9GAST|nr:ATP-binding cassette sub-family G member 5 [Elysia marginata]